MGSWLPDDTRLMSDVASAEWVVGDLRFKGFERLSSFVPAGYSAYVRVLHPPGERPGDSRAEYPVPGIGWTELAAAQGLELTSDASFQSISGVGTRPSESTDLEPLSGSLPPRTCMHLISVLERFTPPGERCWFCLWDGNGFFWSADLARAPSSFASRDTLTLQERGKDDLVDLRSVQRVRTDAREYFLCAGPLEASCAFYDLVGATPNLWWPGSRDWIVVTEVDSYSTYVGCNQIIASQILNADGLEAIEAQLSDRIDGGSGGR